MSRIKKIVAISIVTGFIASAIFAGCTTHTPPSDLSVAETTSFYSNANHAQESSRNDEPVSESHSNSEFSKTFETLESSNSETTSETSSTYAETSVYEETSVQEETSIEASDEILSEDFLDEASDEVSEDFPDEASDEVSEDSSVEAIEVTSEQSTSILCYGICKQDTLIIIEDGSYDELYKGQQVAILRNLDDTYQILWQESTAKVDATCLQLFGSDFVPDFSKGQWAGCITN